MSTEIEVNNCFVMTFHIRMKHFATFTFVVRERSSSVEECLTRDRRAAGSSLTGVTALFP